MSSTSSLRWLAVLTEKCDSVAYKQLAFNSAKKPSMHNKNETILGIWYWVLDCCFLFRVQKIIRQRHYMSSSAQQGSWQHRQLPGTRAKGADCAAVEAKLRPCAAAVAALVAPNKAGVAGAADAAAEATLKDSGAEAGAVVAGSGVLTAEENSDAPAVLPAVLAALVGGN